MARQGQLHQFTLSLAVDNSSPRSLPTVDMSNYCHFGTFEMVFCCGINFVFPWWKLNIFSCVYGSFEFPRGWNVQVFCFFSLLGCFIFVLTYRHSLYSLDINPLVICIGTSRFGFSFHALYEIFWLNEVYKCNVIEFIILFLLWFVLFVSYSRNLFLLWDHKDTLLF